MAKLDIRRIVKTTLERVKQSEHVKDTDPSIVHLEENVVRSIAELEVARSERTAPNPESLPADAAAPARNKRHLRNAA